MSKIADNESVNRKAWYLISLLNDREKLTGQLAELDAQIGRERGLVMEMARGFGIPFGEMEDFLQVNSPTVSEGHDGKKRTGDPVVDDFDDSPEAIQRTMRLYGIDQ
jgi:hypothetical protein